MNGSGGSSTPSPGLGRYPLLIMLALLVSPTISWSQQPYREMANSAMRAGDYKNAVIYREAALVTALKIFKEEDLEIVMRRAELGEAYREMGRWKEAIQQLEYAWKRNRYDAETKGHWKEEEGTMAVSIAEKLGRACQGDARYEDALIVFQTGYSDCARAGREDEYAMHFTALMADTYLLLKKDEDADKMVARAVEMTNRGQVYSPAGQSNVYLRLASLYLQHRHFDKAEPLARKAMELQAKALESQAKAQSVTTPDQLLVKETLASILIPLDKLDEAEVLLKGAMEEALKFNTADSEEVMGLQESVGQVALKRGHLEDALTHFQEAYRICKLRYPDQHPETAKCLSDLGECYLAMKDTTNARAAAKQALAIAEKTLGNDHPQTVAAKEMMAKLKQP